MDQECFKVAFRIVCRVAPKVKPVFSSDSLDLFTECSFRPSNRIDLPLNVAIALHGSLNDSRYVGAHRE